ncbi:MAG TPA: hypothetical protein VND21_10120 [Planctomycetota bacterium]|nr:hypothetical protein [Planctomycetota bacterium]
MGPPPSPPLLLVCAAPPGGPGVEDALASAEAWARDGAKVGVLFSEDGLAGAASGWPKRLRDAGARAAVCGRSARGRRIDPATLPAEVEWTSLTAFLRELPEGTRLWGLFP